ncbi:MAG: stalk domain-containing protein [Clostridia bacterium]|nr:stalk domain-containing protein [Clostridia bacterium]
MKCLLALFSLAAMLFASYCASAQDAQFVHPGLLHTEEDLARIREKLAAGEEPYVSGWKKLEESSFSQAGQGNRATETIVRGGNGSNYSLLYTDIAKAYQCALRWKITGSVAHADTARDILNAWSATLKAISGNADRFLAAGIYGYELACAAELMRDYEGFELERMQNMMLEVFYKPLSERFLISNEFGSDHNDAYITNYWANWDLCNMACAVAVGVLCDRRDIYDIGVEYFKHGAGNGSIYNAIPYLYPGSLAQWQESGRDQGHAQLGIGLMAATCEMAWNQGDDLYGWANNRFMYAAEYVARYNNGKDVPFVTYDWGSGQKGDWQYQESVSSITRGESRPIWEMIYNHYANRRGMNVPSIKERAEKGRPEGGAGGHATTFDQVGFGTLLYTRDSEIVSTASLPDGNIQEGTYKIRLKSGGKFLAVKDSALIVSDTAAEWVVAHLGGGQYAISDKASSLVLGVKDYSFDNGAAVILDGYRASESQKWAFIPVEDGFYRITAVHNNKVLDFAAAQDALVQWRYLLGENQKWSLEAVKLFDADTPVNADAQKIYVTLNGIPIESNAEPFIQNDRTMIPMRAIFEALGAIVEWDGETRSISCIRKDTFLDLRIDCDTAYLNDEAVALDSPPILVNDRTFVPLRFVAQSLGATVSWNEATRTAEILTNDIAELNN